MECIIKSIFAVFLFFVASSIFCMDEPALFLPKDILCLVTNYLKHKDICSFAETNKAYNKYMCDTAAQRKTLLRANLGIPMGAYIHKYGSKRLYVNRDAKVKDRLWVRRTNINTLLSDGAALFDGFIAPLPHKPAPFLDDQGEFSFYGYGITEEFYDSVYSTVKSCQVDRVVKYSYDGTHIPCSVEFICCPSQMFAEASLYLFLEYPVLLKAILDSPIVRTKQEYLASGDAFVERPLIVFSLENVILPDNYAERVAVSDITVPCHTNSFEDFRENIKEAIKKRYKEQSKNDAASIH